MANTSPTDQHIRLALMIDRHVTDIVAGGGGDEELLESALDQMATFKQLLDTCSTAQMNALCERYDGFFRFAKLLEMMAEGLADGRITVPR